MTGSLTSGLWPQEYADSVSPTPRAADSVSHRRAIPLAGGGAACDCGEEFEGIVDLEWHQHGFRHPGRRRVQ